MAENVLKKIINTKSEKILKLKKNISLETLEELIKKANLTKEEKEVGAEDEE